MTISVIQVCEAFAYGAANSVTFLAELARKEGMRSQIVYGEREGGDVAIRHAKSNDHELVELERPNGFSSHFRNIIALRKTIKEAQRAGSVLVHAHSSYAGLYSRIAGMGLAAKVIYSPRGYAFLRQDVSAIEKAFYWVVEALLARSALTVACGPYEYELAQKLGGKATLISNGVPIPSNVDTSVVGQGILGAGRICYQKGFDIFLEIARNCPDVEFRWAGAPDPKSEDMIKNIPDNVTLLGQISSAQMSEEIENCRAILLPSRWEGLSRFLIESISHGKVVITSDYPGNADVLEVKGGAYINGYSCSRINDYISAVRHTVESNELGLMQKRSKCYAERMYCESKNNQSWVSLYRSIEN